MPMQFWPALPKLRVWGQRWWREERHVQEETHPQPPTATHSHTHTATHTQSHTATHIHTATHSHRQPAHVHAAHGVIDDLLKVRVLAHDDRVLAAQLEHHRLQHLGAAQHHVAADARRPGEDDLVYGGTHQRRASVREAGDQLHKLRIVARCREDLTHQAQVVRAAPGGVLRGLAHHGVAGEQAGDDVVQHVVEGVVPRRDDAQHAHRHVLHPRGLVHHHEVGLAVAGSQRGLALPVDPRDLLARRHDLAQQRVHARLARVPRGQAADVVLAGEDGLVQHPHHAAALREGGLRPRHLCGTRTVHARGDGGGVHGDGLTQEVVGGRVPAQDLAGARLVPDDARGDAGGCGLHGVGFICLHQQQKTAAGAEYSSTVV